MVFKKKCSTDIVFYVEPMIKARPRVKTSGSRKRKENVSLVWIIWGGVGQWKHGLYPAALGPLPTGTRFVLGRAVLSARRLHALVVASESEFQWTRRLRDQAFMTAASLLIHTQSRFVSWLDTNSYFISPFESCPHTNFSVNMRNCVVDDSKEIKLELCVACDSNRMPIKPSKEEFTL